MSIGYTTCPCRDCMEISMDNDYCDDCHDAGCEDQQGVEGMDQECQSPNAYGCGENSPNEPEPQDYVLADRPHAGYVASEYDGAWRQEFKSVKRALKALRKRMKAEQFWPTVWYQSDHGNLWPINHKTGDEIK